MNPVALLMCWRRLWAAREGYIYLLVCLYPHTYADFISRNCFRGFPFSYCRSPSNALLPAMQTNWQINPLPPWCPPGTLALSACPNAPSIGTLLSACPESPSLEPWLGTMGTGSSRQGRKGWEPSRRGFCLSEQGARGHLIRDGNINPAAARQACCRQRQQQHPSPLYHALQHCPRRARLPQSSTLAACQRWFLNRSSS